MSAKFTGLTHKIALHMHLLAEGYTICSSCSRRPVRKPLDTPSYDDQQSKSDQLLLHVGLIISFNSSNQIL